MNVQTPLAETILKAGLRILSIDSQIPHGSPLSSDIDLKTEGPGQCLP